MYTPSLREHMIVETDWLADHLDDPKLRIVDIRGTILPVSHPPPWYFSSHDAYLNSHIPGAVFVDWLVDLVDAEAPIKATTAKPEQIAQVMGRLGIGNQHRVVIYDDDGCHIAARLWWILRHMGHTQVALLNGGWPKWTAEHRPVTSEVPAYPETIFQTSMDWDWKADVTEVTEAITTSDTVLVDCRGVDMYQGQTTRGSRKGRIPGAVNVPYAALVEGPYKTWRSDEELRQIFANVGVQEQNKVITYCNAGVSASVGLFALRMLQLPHAKNFDGSWYAWEHDPNNPVELDIG